MLKVGTEAPDFNLRDNQGKSVSLGKLRGRTVVLIFYPGDNTPLCTAQLCEVRDKFAEFTAAGATVLGVNPFNAASHKRFAEKNRFQFPLLVDPGLKVSRAYGCVLGWGPLSFVNRTVYVVGPDGKVRFAKRGKPSPKEVLDAIRAGN